VTFFFDNCMSKKIPEALTLVKRSTCTHLQNHFEGNVHDTKWIPFVGQKRWVAVSGDLKILLNDLEKQALADADIITYFVWRGYTTAGGWNQFKWIIAVWDKIVEHSKSASTGHHYQVRLDGSIHEVTCYDDLA
jgi:hypothetical protein